MRLRCALGPRLSAPPQAAAWARQPTVCPAGRDPFSQRECDCNNLLSRPTSPSRHTEVDPDRHTENVILVTPRFVLFGHQSHSAVRKPLPQLSRIAGPRLALADDMANGSFAASEFFLGTGRPTDEAAAPARTGQERAEAHRKLKALDGGLAESCSDEQLVARAQRSDAVAFHELVRRHQKRVYQLVFSIVKEREQAMDLVQDTFLKIHQNLPGFKGDAAFFTWSYRIAYNLAIDARRRQRRFEHVEINEAVLPDGDTPDDPYAATSASPQKAALRHELSLEIQRALATLHENHRAILMLREVDGLSYEELAKVMGIPKGTVMSRLFHARQKLQAALREYVGDDPAQA